MPPSRRAQGGAIVSAPTLASRQRARQALLARPPRSARSGLPLRGGQWAMNIEVERGEESREEAQRWYVYDNALRLDCYRHATSALSTNGRIAAPNEVLPVAMALYMWVTSDSGVQDEVGSEITLHPPSSPRGGH